MISEQQKCLPCLTKLYKEFHQIPQLGLHEHKTTNLILHYIGLLQQRYSNTILQVLKPQIETDLNTGLIVLLKKTKTTSSSQNAYLFRCDIDALPFKQQSQLDYASSNGLHHACGHDAHVTIMLTAIQKILKNVDKVKRDLYFCFQPGEEGCGGARKLIEKYPHLFFQLNKCFALHAANHRPKNTLLIPSQYATANSNRFMIQIKGRSAHCMLPHIAIDANYIGCQIVTQIYSISSRLVQPSTGLALSITKIEAGSNLTSISDTFKMWGSLRSYDPLYHKKVLIYIEKFVKNLCELHGAENKIEVNQSHYRAVKNEKQAIDIVYGAAKKIFETIQFVKPSFAGEDFCQFSERIPSCYFNIGVGLPNSFNNGQSIYPIHSNKFKLDESALEKGSQIWAEIAFTDL